MAGRSRASKCVCGVHDSQYECDVVQLLLLDGVKFGYEVERLEYQTPGLYRPDITLANNIIVEAKGWFPASDRKKMLAVIAANPDRDVRMLFMRASDKLRRGSKTTVAMWCDNHDIEWAQGPGVPKAWLT